jgi:hypothetical protein
VGLSPLQPPFRFALSTLARLPASKRLLQSAPVSATGSGVVAPAPMDAAATSSAAGTGAGAQAGVAAAAGLNGAADASLPLWAAGEPHSQPQQHPLQLDPAAAAMAPPAPSERALQLWLARHWHCPDLIREFFGNDVCSWFCSMFPDLSPDIVEVWLRAETSRVLPSDRCCTYAAARAHFAQMAAPAYRPPSLEANFARIALGLQEIAPLPDVPAEEQLRRIAADPTAFVLAIMARFAPPPPPPAMGKQSGRGSNGSAMSKAAPLPRMRPLNPGGKVRRGGPASYALGIEMGPMGLIDHTGTGGGIPQQEQIVRNLERERRKREREREAQVKAERKRLRNEQARNASEEGFALLMAKHGVSVPEQVMKAGRFSGVPSAEPTIPLDLDGNMGNYGYDMMNAQVSMSLVQQGHLAPQGVPGGYVMDPAFMQNAQDVGGAAAYLSLDGTLTTTGNAWN